MEKIKRVSPMQELLRKFDWASTSIGEVEAWPAALTSAVNICMNARFPVMILLGKDMYQVYNDYYKEIIGIHHPKAFGARARDIWGDLWPEIGPMLKGVLAGESVLMENHPFVLKRKGYDEQCYFTFSYSPIPDASGIVGIFVAVNETTSLVLMNEKLRTLRNKHLSNLFVQAPIALAILRGPQYIVEIANSEILKLWGKTADEVMDKPVFEGIPEARNQGFEDLLAKVYFKGERIVINENPLRLIRYGKEEEFFIKLTYEAIREEDGSITGIMVLADEVTEQVNARKQIQQAELGQRLAIEAAQIGTFDLNLQDESFAYSDRLAHIFGFADSKNMSRQHLVERIHPDDAELRNKAHERAIETGILSYEARTIWPDDSVHWFRANGTVVFDNKKKPWKMFGTVLDITDQKTAAERLEKLVQERTVKLNQQHEELKRSEERYHKMVDEVQDYAIILLDKDGIIQNWNKGAENIKQYKEHEAVGRSFHIFYRPEDREAGLPDLLISEARKNGRATREGWRVRKDGTRFWGSVAITALHDDEGNIIGFSKVTRDLTERKQAEDTLREYTLELEAQNRELEQFAYVASHDLQEPLRKIQTFSEIIQKNLDNAATVNRYLGKMNASAKRMGELIKSVLNYSKVSREGQGMSDVSLHSIVDDVIRDFELLIQEKNALIEIGDLPVIRGFPLHLNQLFANLIGNSLKFTNTQPIMKISARVVGKEAVVKRPDSLTGEQFVEVIVSDNGIGFDEQFEKQIFTMFQRLHGKHEYAGTGIGLAICKKIMENHGGHITARSKMGEGATFYLYFPGI